MIKYEILPITEEYIENYAAVLDSVARERQYLLFLEAPPLATSREFVLRNIKNNFPHFVAIHEGKVIGWCDIIPSHFTVLAHIGSLGMGVLMAYRGMRIGEALIRKALEKSKAQGLTRIELKVLENNERAIALYEKLGFEKEGFHRNAYCIDGQYKNFISMALLFN